MLPKTELKESHGTWKTVKNCCRVTDNKDFSEGEPSDSWKKKMVIAEHSPIRILEYLWLWPQMPYWVSTEHSRTKAEKFISSQRDDRLVDDTPRGKKPQDAPVNYTGFANLQSLIDTARKRLCFCATPEARAYMVSLKFELKDAGYKIESDAMVPNCVYRCGCPEGFNKSCSFFDTFAKIANEEYVNLLDIQQRYDLYNRLLEKTERGK